MFEIIKILSISVLFFLQGNSGQTGFTLLKNINNTGNFITVDDLGNLFLVNGERLIKFDVNGRLLYSYSNLYNGNISFVDVRDPFKIMLYYKDFAQIIFLDNFLSKSTDPVILESLGLELATLACSSYNNGFWVYLPQSFELVRVGQDMVISHKTGDISRTTNNEIDPNYLLEKDNMLYLNDPDIGILIFDKYGAYYKTIPMKNLEYFQVEGNNIISNSDINIRIYNLKSSEEALNQLPEDDPVCVNLKYSFNPKRLFLLNENGINIYSVNPDQ